MKEIWEQVLANSLSGIHKSKIICSAAKLNFFKTPAYDLCILIASGFLVPCAAHTRLFSSLASQFHSVYNCLLARLMVNITEAEMVLYVCL
jgi:hypothetical protein